MGDERWPAVTDVDSVRPLRHSVDDVSRLWWGGGAVRMGRVDGGAAGTVVQRGWVRVDGGAVQAARAGSDGVWMGASVVARAHGRSRVPSVVTRARGRKHVRAGGGAVVGDAADLGRNLADQLGAHVLEGPSSSTSLAMGTLSLVIGGALAEVVEEL